MFRQRQYIPLPSAFISAIHSFIISPNYTDFVLLLNGFFLQARPGFIVTTASDTVRGEVDYRGDAAMNEACRFRMEGQQPVEYAPGTTISSDC